jgi:hypothetical protein
MVDVGWLLCALGPYKNFELLAWVPHPILVKVNVITEEEDRPTEVCGVF